MPRYRLGTQSFRRKNLYIPCLIAKRFDELPAEKRVEVYKKTWWCDLLTETAWRTILKHNPPSYKDVVRSRLKKKMIGWLTILGRVAIFDPELYASACEESKKLYEELCGFPNPLFE